MFIMWVTLYVNGRGAAKVMQLYKIGHAEGFLSFPYSPPKAPMIVSHEVKLLVSSFLPARTADYHGWSAQPSKEHGVPSCGPDAGRHEQPGTSSLACIIVNQCKQIHLLVWISWLEIQFLFARRAFAFLVALLCRGRGGGSEHPLCWRWVFTFLTCNAELLSVRVSTRPSVR